MALWIKNQDGFMVDFDGVCCPATLPTDFDHECTTFVNTRCSSEAIIMIGYEFETLRPIARDMLRQQ
jgi:hypothetical protein